MDNYETYYVNGVLRKVQHLSPRNTWKYYTYRFTGDTVIPAPNREEADYRFKTFTEELDVTITEVLEEDTYEHKR